MSDSCCSHHCLFPPFLESPNNEVDDVPIQPSLMFPDVEVESSISADFRFSTLNDLKSVPK